MITHYFLPLIIVSGICILSCKTKTKIETETEIVNVPSNWNGVCGSTGQPGEAVTLHYNSPITSSNQPLFRGSCGALGTTCEFNGNTKPFPDADKNGYSGTYLQITSYLGSNCSGTVQDSGTFAYLLSTDTIATLAGGVLSCVPGGSIQIFFVPHASTATPLITLASSSTSSLISCSLPLADFGDTTVTCFECPI